MTHTPTTVSFDRRLPTVIGATYLIEGADGQKWYATVQALLDGHAVYDIEFRHGGSLRSYHVNVRVAIDGSWRYAHNLQPVNVMEVCGGYVSATEWCEARASQELGLPYEAPATPDTASQSQRNAH